MELSRAQLVQMRELNPTQVVIFLYLQSSGELQQELCISQIARDLNLTRKTVSKAIDILQQYGYLHRQLATCTLLPLSQNLSPEMSPEKNLPVSQNLSLAPEKNLLVSENLSLEQNLPTHEENLLMGENSSVSEKSVVGKGFQGTGKKFPVHDLDQDQDIYKYKKSSKSNRDRDRGGWEENTQGSLLSFVIKQLKGRGIAMRNPIAYAQRCITNQPDYWRGLWQEAVREVKAVLPSMEMLIGGLRLAWRAKDWEFVQGRLQEIAEIAPDIAANLRQELQIA